MSKILTESFYEKVLEDLKLDNIEEENLSNQSKQHYYLQILVDKKRQFYKLESIKTNIFKELYQYYKFEYDYNLKGSEIEIYIKADPKFKRPHDLSREVSLEIEYLEQVVKSFQNRAFAIKNMIDIKKLEH